MTLQWSHEVPKFHLVYLSGIHQLHRFSQAPERVREPPSRQDHRRPFRRHSSGPVNNPIPFFGLFLQSRIGSENTVAFSEHTIQVCVTCFQKCPGTSACTHLILSLWFQNQHTRRGWGRWRAPFSARNALQGTMTEMNWNVGNNVEREQCLPR